MNAIEIVARLLRGDPENSVDYSAVGIPYNEAIHAILTANGGGRDNAWRDWLTSRPQAEQATLQQSVDQSTAQLEADAPAVMSLVEGTVAAYLRQTRTLANALAPWEQVPDIVKGLLPARSLTIIYGPPGSHKTNLMLDLAFAVATGQPWLTAVPGTGASQGYPVNRQPVLWVDADSGHDVLKERIAAFARAYSPAEGTCFHWLTFPVPPVQAARSLEDFIVYAKALGVKLIVFDNLLRVGGFKDENSSEVDAAMSALRKLAEATGAAVVVIHHRRKQTQADRAGDTMRGHSSIEAAIDAGLLVTREAKSDVLHVTCTKARRKPIADFAAQFTFEHQDDGETLYTARFYHSDDQAPKENAQDVAMAATKQHIINVIRKAEGPLNKSQTLALVRGRRAQASTAIDELADAGILTVNDGPHGSKLYAVMDN